MTTQATPPSEAQQLADARTALAVHIARIAELEAIVNALRFEAGAIEHAAHMPVDYAYGLPTWINMVLYSAYIGMDIGPHNREWAVRMEERWEASALEVRKLRDERDELERHCGELGTALAVVEEVQSKATLS